MKVNQSQGHLKGCLPFASLLGKLFGEEVPPVATNYSGVNFYALILRWTRLGDDAFEDILSTLGTKIEDAFSRIQDAAQSGNQDDAEVVADEESSLVESLLGLSFVLCQAQIERIVSGVIRLHARTDREPTPVSLQTTGRKRPGILKSKGSGGSQRTVTDIEAIDALANYYKHGSSWETTDWSKLQGDSARKTAKMVQHAGASSGSSANFRNGFQHITSHQNYSELSDLATVVQSWESTLLETYEAELRKKALLP